MAAATRGKSSCPIFGATAKLPNYVLPTYIEVIRYFNQVRFNLMVGNRNPSFLDIADPVILAVEKIWKKASIPTVSHVRIVQILRAYHTKYKSLLKPYKGRKRSNTYNTKLEAFRKEALRYV